MPVKAFVLQCEPARRQVHQRCNAQLCVLATVHFSFQGSDLCADFIVGFQFGEFLIQRFLFANTDRFSLGFHVIDAAFKLLKTRHRFINFTAVQLTANVTGR